MNFVKQTTFKMNGRTFEILSVLNVQEFARPTGKDIYNCIEFVEIDPDVTYVDEITGRRKHKKYAPKPIEAKSEEERYYEAWRKMQNTNIRSKEYLIDLIDKGIINY